MIKKIVLIFAIASLSASCGNGGGSSTSSDSTVNSITPPLTPDSANAIAPMMGDTSKIDADSLKK